MKICFIDEAGDLGFLGNPPSPIDQPVLVVGGLFIDSSRLADITGEFLELKSRFFPGLRYPPNKHLDCILHEIKGSDLRKDATRGTPRECKHAIGFLDHIFGLLHHHEVRIVARVWIKVPGGPFDGTEVYTSSIQRICGYFEHYLADAASFGSCIADSRHKAGNSSVSHSIFTQKFGAADCYPHIVELPTFGHSDNHAGLQICDIVCSALLYPIACFVYCTGHVENVHVQPRADRLRKRYGRQLQTLQHRYVDPTKNRYAGGIVVSDHLGHQSGSLMFRPQ